MGDEQMKYQHYLEDVVSDLTDLALGLMEQWRCVLAAGLIVAVLLPSAKYFTSVRSFNSMVTGVEKALDGSVNLGGELERPVVRALSYYSQYSAKRAYFTDSRNTDINGTMERRLTLLYFIRTQSSGSGALTVARLYEAMSTDQELQYTVADALGMSSDDDRLKELYFYTIQDPGYSGTDRMGASFTFTIVIPENVTPDDPEGRMMKYLQSKKEMFEKQVGPYDIDLVTSFYSNIDNQSRIDTQIDYYKKLSTAETAFVAAYKTCSQQGKVLVSSMISRDMVDSGLRKLRRGDIEGLKEELMSKEPVTESDGKADSDLEALLSGNVVASPSFPILYIPIGFIGGMILYAVFYILVRSTDRYARNASDMKRLTGLRSFGEIYEYPYKGIKRFAHDKKVYALRHKESGVPKEEIGRIADKLSAKAKHMNLSDISLVVMGTPTDRKEMILQEQISELEKKGIHVNCVAADKGVSSIEEDLFNHMSPVFMVFLSGITTSVMVRRLMNRLKEYEVPAFGTELIESE